MTQVAKENKKGGHARGKKRYGEEQSCKGEGTQTEGKGGD